MSARIVLAEGKHLRLVREGHWEYAERTRASGAVVLVAVTADGRLLLTEQYRVPLARKVIELPAGLTGDDDGHEQEPADQSARRELLEETGYENKEEGGRRNEGRRQKEEGRRSKGEVAELAGVVLGGAGQGPNSGEFGYGTA